MYQSSPCCACSWPNQSTSMAALQLLSFLNLVLINIRGAVGNESQLAAAVHSLKEQPDIILLSETKMGPGDQINIKGYTCWSQPDPKKIGGTAFLIHDRLMPVCTPTSPPHSEEHPSTGHTQWIRILNKHKPVFISLSYISPNDLLNYTRTMDALTEAGIVMSSVGTCIHTGDFNSHEAKHRTIFNKMTKTLKLEDMHNPICTQKGEHWTFQGHGGVSCPDHILIPQSLSNEKNIYWVYQEHDCGSDHRLMQANIVFSRLENITWGTYKNRTCDWDKITLVSQGNAQTAKQRYKGVLSECKGLVGEDTYRDMPRDKKTIIKLAEQITSDITKAYIHISKKQEANSGTKREREKPHKHSGMYQRKKMLLNHLKDTKIKKADRKATWSSIQKIQTEITADSYNTSNEQNMQWWSELGQSKYPKDPKGFWKHARKLKETVMDSQTFPSVLIDEKGNYHSGPKEVHAHIKATYQAIAANKDSVTKQFHETLNVTKKQKATYNTESKEQYKDYIKEKTINPPPTTPGVTMKRLLVAIKKQKKGKAPGRDEITAECIQNLPPKHIDALLYLYNLMWELSYTPPSWQTAVTILLYKKGDRMDIGNYRPITLLNSLFKTWERLLTTLLSETLGGSSPPPNQFGSQKGTSAPIAILVLRALLRQAGATGQPVYAAQVDLNKAYNRVNRNLLWAKLLKMDVPTTLIQAIESTYTMCKEAIRIGADEGDPYDLTMGLRQGSVLSPILFILYTASLLEELNGHESGIETGHEILHRLNAIMFVDDLFTLSTNLKDLENQCLIINQWALESCGVVSFEKSTITTTPLSEKETKELQKTRTHLKHTTSTIHLGTKVNLKEFIEGYTNLGADVGHRIGKAKSILGAMTKKGLRKGAVATQPGITIMSTTALKSLTYGLSSPHLTSVDKKCMNNTMAQPIATLLGLPSVTTPEEAIWLLHDTGMTPPSVLISVNDSTSLLLAQEGKTDHISSAILPLDEGLTRAVDKFMTEINTTRGHLKMKKQKERSGFLIARARKATNEKLTPPYSLLSPIMTPILTRTNTLQTSTEKALLRARYHYCHPPTDTCDYCDTGQPHSVEHALCHCTYPPLLSRRSTTVNNITIPTILDGREGNKTYAQLHQLLAQLAWSPHYYPKA